MTDSATASSATPNKPKTKTLRTSLRRIVLILLFCYGAVLLLLAAFENSLLYFPEKYPSGDWTLPDGVEEAYFEAKDGTKLHGWYFPHPSPRGYVLFSHGNGGSVSLWSDAAKVWRDHHRVSVLLYDYRGYGKSDGSPNEAGILQDARAARAWLASRAGIGEQDIIQFGQSLGGAVAVDLAARDGTRGLILSRTFSSLRDVAAQKFPWVPVRFLMRHKLDSVSKIADYHGPTLICHGDADPVVPLEFARKLFAAANEPKRFVVDPGGDHNCSLSNSFHQSIDEYLDTLNREK